VGSSNVLRVYHSWSHLDDRPFRLLAYMALRARDHDAEPWYGAGHEELAMIALGLAMATDRERDAGFRAVRRAFTALHKARALKTIRHARPGKQASYRLFLDGPTQDGERPVNNPAETAGRRTLSDLWEAANVGRSATERRTVSDRTQDAHRPTEEEEEEEELKDPEANLRNGEMWKGAPPHLNGSAEPAKTATPRTHHA
jgi:hypothetical protein